MADTLIFLAVFSYNLVLASTFNMDQYMADCSECGRAMVSVLHLEQRFKIMEQVFQTKIERIFMIHDKLKYNYYKN